jgi:hypothetical protein
VPFSTHLGVEAVGFAEFALATRIIAPAAGQLGALLVHMWREDRSSRLLDQGSRAVEGSFEELLDRAESTRQGDESISKLSQQGL